MKKMMLEEGDEPGEEPIIELPQIQLYIENIGFQINGIAATTPSVFFYNNLYSYGGLDEIDIPPKG
jgi:hypothetical protein